jgi:hypothetical protein
VVRSSRLTGRLHELSGVVAATTGSVADGLKSGVRALTGRFAAESAPLPDPPSSPTTEPRPVMPRRPPKLPASRFRVSADSSVPLLPPVAPAAVVVFDNHDAHENHETAYAGRGAFLGNAIYSASDRDVRPPMSIRSKMRVDAVPDPLPADAAHFLLLVSTSGDVESVHLLGGPVDVPTSMMLSALKAWRFQPAEKNGTPVRYRLVLLAR